MKKEKSGHCVDAAGEGSSRGSDIPGVSLRSSRKLEKMSAYERAKKVYEQIQEQKKRENAARLLERERRQAVLEKYMRSKKQMNKALRKCNRKGQPNLGAQMEVLLKKIENSDRK